MTGVICLCLFIIFCFTNSDKLKDHPSALGPVCEKEVVRFCLQNDGAVECCYACFVGLFIQH